MATSSAAPATRTMETLNFDNLALRALPIDSVKENFLRQVSGACFSIVEPTPVENPKTVAVSQQALSLIDLAPEQVNSPDFATYFSGNKVFPGARPAAHCYCGHQFGAFSGQLGDGATMYLGEVVNAKNERWEVQFKGAGPTPYSRQADGRKVLRSSLREFLCSEAMWALGIPTTRAASIVTSDTKVVRDILYSGNPIEERASIIMRIAPTFLRFGSFEIFKPTDRLTQRAGPSVGKETPMLFDMLNYTIETFYPDIHKQFPEVAQQEDRYAAFYEEISKRTARLVAAWQCVGWCHGVLNTDNMSIVGVTIDYGPFGFLDSFNPNHICNGSDHEGRYSYKNQPEMCQFNLAKLGEAIAVALPLARSRPLLKVYGTEFEKHYSAGMRAKLGLKTERPEDEELFAGLFSTMAVTGADFTNTFRALARVTYPGASATADQDLDKVVEYLATQGTTVAALKRAYAPRVQPDQLRALATMAQRDPQMLQRYGIDLNFIKEEFDNMQKRQDLDALSDADKLAADMRAWKAWLIEYTGRLGRETDGASGDALAALNTARAEAMNKVNPAFILRNYVLQSAIAAAEAGDFTESQKLLDRVMRPYDEASAEETYTTPKGERVCVRGGSRAPDWAGEICVTCSS